MAITSSHAPFAGKYQVERVLGQGGMGTIFEARHIRIGQRVAIKVLGAALCDQPDLVQRFEREARACGALTSAHAVRVFDIDTTDDGTPFIVMELLAGCDLAQIIDREGPQPVSRSVRWVIEACDAIAEAHSLGIIHRDLKPSNLFLTVVEGRSVVKVLDFGIAKRVTSGDAAITHALAPLGTPHYMSPEQVRCSKTVDARTDIWSLGVTLYELVTGKTPFPDASSTACIAAIAADPIPDPRTHRPELGDAFVDVLMRALTKDVGERYQTIEQLVAAIAPFANVHEDAEIVSAVRRAALSIADRTVPPATSCVTRVKPRFSAALAFASAAALGLATVVLVARLGAAEAPSNASVAAASAVEPVDAPAVASLPTPTAVLAAAVLLAEEPTPAPPPVVPPPRVAAPPAKPVAPRALAFRPLVAALAPLPTSDAKHAGTLATRDRRPPATGSRIAHGGLSSPGF